MASVPMYPDQETRILNGRVYEPVGRCIYCGATDALQKEHILPFGLDGTAVLPKASCPKCSRITGTQEQILLRGPMWAVRLFRGLASRTKHADAPSTYPIAVIREGQETIIQLPLSEYPILLHFPLFAPPAILGRPGYTYGIATFGLATLSFGPRPEEVLRKHKATAISLTQANEPVAFARVIAKIAYAWAVAEGAIDSIDGRPLILPALLGEVDDIGRWVGTITGPFKAHGGALHRIELHYDTNRGLLIGEVQLFSDSQTPSYGVVLGRLA